VTFGDSHMVIGLVLEKKDKDKSEDNNSPPLNLLARKASDKILLT
jgi:hypothetical protein